MTFHSYEEDMNLDILYRVEVESSSSGSEKWYIAKPLMEASKISSFDYLEPEQSFGFSWSEMKKRFFRKIRRSRRELMVAVIAAILFTLLLMFWSDRMVKLPPRKTEPLHSTSHSELYATISRLELMERRLIKREFKLTSLLARMDALEDRVKDLAKSLDISKSTRPSHEYSNYPALQKAHSSALSNSKEAAKEGELSKEVSRELAHLRALLEEHEENLNEQYERVSALEDTLYSDFEQLDGELEEHHQALSSLTRQSLQTRGKVNQVIEAIQSADNQIERLNELEVVVERNKQELQSDVNEQKNSMQELKKRIDILDNFNNEHYETLINTQYQIARLKQKSHLAGSNEPIADIQELAASLSVLQDAVSNDMNMIRDTVNALINDIHNLRHSSDHTESTIWQHAQEYQRLTDDVRSLSEAFQALSLKNHASTPAELASRLDDAEMRIDWLAKKRESMIKVMKEMLPSSPTSRAFSDYYRIYGTSMSPLERIPDPMNSSWMDEWNRKDMAPRKDLDVDRVDERVTQLKKEADDHFEQSRQYYGLSENEKDMVRRYVSEDKVKVCEAEWKK